jgi:hypothetical protein
MGREREQTGEVHLETVLKPFLIPFHSRTNGKFCKQDPYRLSGMPLKKVDTEKNKARALAVRQRLRNNIKWADGR